MHLYKYKEAILTIQDFLTITKVCQLMSLNKVRHPTAICMLYMYKPLPMKQLLFPWATVLMELVHIGNSSWRRHVSLFNVTIKYIQHVKQSINIFSVFVNYFNVS